MTLAQCFVTPAGQVLRSLQRPLVTAAANRSIRTAIFCGKETPAKLVSASWLQKQQSVQNMRILDVRGRVTKPSGRVESGLQRVEYIADDDAYDTAHIPEAVFVDWRDINLADSDSLCDMFGRSGVVKDEMVVVYDWGDMLFATRLWYAMVCAGCSNVAILNGGWQAWEKNGGEYSTDSECPLRLYEDFARVEVKGWVGLDEMRELVGARSSEVVLVDARSKKQYDGVERRGKRAGHIRGAVNIPYRSLLEDENGGGLKRDEEIGRVLQERGLLERNNGRIVVYCNGGVSATVVIFCLVRCGIGMQRVQSYCASMNEWSNLEDTEVVIT